MSMWMMLECRVLECGCLLMKSRRNRRFLDDATNFVKHHCGESWLVRRTTRSWCGHGWYCARRGLHILRLWLETQVQLLRVKCSDQWLCGQRRWCELLSRWCVVLAVRVNH